MLVLNEKQVEIVEGTSSFIGPGPFVNALEFVSASTSKLIVGKPSTEFYDMVLKCKDFLPSETMVIGDVSWKNIRNYMLSIFL